MPRAAFPRLWSFLFLCLLTGVSQAGEALTLGVFAYRPKPVVAAQYQPLADYLSAQLPGVNVQLQVLEQWEMERALAEHQLDLVFTNPSHYLVLRNAYQLSGALATLVRLENGQPTHSLGGVIIANERAGITDIAHLDGRRIAIPGTKFLGGYQTQSFELWQAGVRIPGDVALQIVGHHDAVVAAVVAGEAEAGFIRTGVIEQLTAEGKLDPARLHIVNRQYPADFPYVVSTRLYPEWPFIALPHVKDETVSRITAALLALEAGHPAARAADIAGFAPPADYLPVEQLARALRLPPYEAAPEFTLSDVWERHQASSMGLLFALVVILILFILLQRRTWQAMQSTAALSASLTTLEQERARTQRYLDTAQTMMVALDAEGNITMLNRFGCHMLGYAEDELLGRNWFASCLPQPEGMRKVYPVFRRIMAGEMGADEYFENSIQCRSGRQRLIAWHNAELCDEQGNIIGVLSSGQDITERRRAEEELRESESRLRIFIERFPGGVLVENAQRRILLTNQAFCDLFHIPVAPAHLVGADCRDSARQVQGLFAEPEDFVQRIDALLEQQAPVLGDELVMADGRVLERDYVPIRGNGRFIGHIWLYRDITARKQGEAELKVLNTHLTALIEALPDAIFFKDGAGRWLVTNEAAKALFQLHGVPWQGKTEEELAALRPAFRAAHEKCRADDEMAWQAKKLSMFEEEIIDETGMVHVYDVRKIPLFDTAGEREGLVVIGRDITVLRQAMERLRLAAGVFTHAREGIVITDVRGTIVDTNEAFSRITGYAREEIVGQNPRLLKSNLHGPEFYAELWRNLAGKGYWQGEIWNRRKDGEIYAELLTISAVHDQQGDATHYIALFSDITAQKEHEQQLEHIAHYDALTGLPNRVLLADRMHQAMFQTQRRGQRLAVAYIDLDGFKAINDTYGHEVGDELLLVVSRRMKQALREGDTIARLGGDEFVAVLLDLPLAETSVPLLTRLLAAAAQPVHVGELTLQVSASLGVTFYPQADDVDADQLLRQADQAMYQAKVAGKNRYHIFDAEQDRNVRGYHESLERIRRALHEREFVLYYQPKVNMRSGEIIGAEALIRWQHPERGLLAPATFLPVIEDHPLCVEVGEWVIDSALAQIEAWHSAGLDLAVSVNVSAGQLQQPDFMERLRALLLAHPGVQSGRLELEILETSALQDLAQVSHIMHACREIGVNFALDDFGTGYSSLTYLKSLPATHLKIDQSFVRGMLVDTDDLAILEGVLSLATAFRRHAIAEGVETLEHGQILLQLGCELGQGYVIARPMPAAELPGWAATWQTDPVWSGCRAVSRDLLPVLFAGVEHRAWIRAVTEHLKGDYELIPPLHEHQCRFGTWLYGEGKAMFGAWPVFAAIESTHHQVHILAAELLALQARGQGSEAWARCSELHHLRDTLIGQLQALLEECREASLALRGARE